MAFVRKIRSKSKEYFVLVHSVRNGKKITQRSKYIGKKLPSEVKLEVLKREFLQKIKSSNSKKYVNNKMIIELKKKIIPILKKYKIKKAGIFGSYARGDFKKKSDVDILVQPTSGMGLKFVGMGIELEEKLKKKVDLVSYKYIHPKLKNQILKDEIRII